MPPTHEPAILVTDAGRLIVADEVRTQSGFWFVTAAQEIDNPPGWVLTFSEITQIKQSMAARERSLQFLSHDLRSPIGAAVTLIERSANRDDTAENDGELAEARRHLRRALTMADNHVLLTKAEEAGLSSKVFDLVSCAQEAVDKAVTMASDAGVELVEDYPDDVVEVRGDPAAVSRSIENLIRNALAHGSQAGQTVTVQVKRKGRMGQIGVTDCNREAIPQIRQALVRYARTGQLSPTIGLGLAYCQTVAEKCSGFLAVTPDGDGKNISLHLHLVPISGS